MTAFQERAEQLMNDNSLGPQHGSAFDFTLTFEESFFSLAPAAILLLVTPIHVMYYRKLKVTSPEDPLMWGKMAINVVLIVLEVVTAGLYISSDATTNIATAASILSCLAAVALAVFMFFEHRYALESSPIVSLYLFITMLLDAASARSYFLRKTTGLYTIACLTAAVAATKLLLLIAEEVPKRYRIPQEKVGPDTKSGFWARTFLVWMNSTIFIGFRNTLSVEDLPNLGEKFSSAKLAAAFEPRWMKQNKSSWKLIKTTFVSLLWSFLAVAPPRLLHTGFKFADPFLMRRILQQVSGEDRDKDVEGGLIGAIALVRLGVAITRVWYEHLNDRLATKTRGVLVSQIFRKSLTLDRDEANKSAAVSLMSTDVAGIVTTLRLLNETWAGLIELILGIYILSTIIKQSAFLSVIPTIIGAFVSIEVMRRSRPAFRDWNQSIEERVSKTSKILGQMVGIKMIGAEMAVGEYVQRLRQTEVDFYKKPRQLYIFTAVAVVLSYTCTPVLVLAGGLYWSGFENGFNATNVFSTLAFVFLVAHPLSNILKSWSLIGELLACFGRIQAYLYLDERQDTRNYVTESLEDKSAKPEAGQSLHDVGQYPLQLRDVTILSPKDKPLFTSNAQFARSTVTMVIGPTGSGKSVLLKALLGEAKIGSGSILAKHQQIGYCDQEVWLRNVTIRDNIMGENAYEEDWYTKVIASCLLHDLNQLPNGHLSPVGSRGSNLSGGQKQRVALARAIYSHAPVLLLDDVTSAVDRSTCSEIATRLLGPDGLLRDLGSTVIMTTHTVELLKFADNVLVIQGDGTVTMETSLGAIKKYGREDFLEGHQNSEDNTSTAKSGTLELKKQPAKDDLRRRGDISLYRYYLGSVRMILFVPWFVVAVLVVVFEKFPDIYLRLWVDKAPENKSLLLGYGLIGIAAMTTVVPWFWLYYTYLVPESACRLHRKLVDRVTESTLSFLTNTDSGTLLNRFSQDMSLIVQDLPTAFIFTLYSFLGVISNVAVVAAGAKYVAIVIPFLFGLLYLIQYYYLRTSRQMRLLDLEAKNPLFSELTESSDGLQHIRAFKWEQEFLDRGLKVLDHSQKPFYYMYCIQRWLNLVLDLAVAAIAVLLVALGFTFASTNQAALGLSLFIIMRVGGDMSILIMTWANLETSLGAVARIRDFEAETPREGSEDRDVAATLPAKWPHHGAIELDNVTAEYTATNSDFKALHNLSLQISAGSKVGLIGRTGSGKSSLLLTLLNFLKYTGKITIDGIDISTVPPHVLRSRITTISQGLVELPCSVRDNLVPHEIATPSEECTDAAKLFEVLDRVGLKDEIEKRGGLDGMIADVGLSAGEKQLFALARALLQNRRTNSKIVLVDEATSNIDYESEKKMQQVMEEAFEGCTVLTIAHRQHTIQSADVVHELSAGRLVTSNTP